MRKIKIRRSYLLISVVMLLSVAGCIKETYNMKMLSKQAHLSPTLAMSAVRGDISLSDAVKSNDTIVYDQNKFVTIIFKKDSVIDLKLSDFSKATVVRTAPIDPTSFDLNIHDVLSHISGDFLIANPTIKFTYTNSFPDSVKINLKASGKRQSKTIDLSLHPFGLTKPNIPTQPVVTSSYLIDKNNSNLPLLVSLPPEIINFSGTVILSTTVKSNQEDNNNASAARLTGSLELDIPLEMKINNLQFTDTVDNFIKDKNSNSDNPLDPSDFQFLNVIITAKNGFPLGASVKMDLYDSATHTVKSTVDATGVLLPAPTDSNGKVSGVNESTTTIVFNRAFFSSVNSADKIILRFTMNSTGNGSQNVKIYSDYKLNFTAALVVKPDINLK
jgi:hypothetical protein